jgi:hypothetical protein
MHFPIQKLILHFVRSSRMMRPDCTAVQKALRRLLRGLVQLDYQCFTGPMMCKTVMSRQDDSRAFTLLTGLVISITIHVCRCNCGVLKSLSVPANVISASTSFIVACNYYEIITSLLRLVIVTSACAGTIVCARTCQ